MLRKIVAAIILVPLAIIIVAFAVANRQSVTVSFDPFSAEAPAASLSLPLFALVIGLLIAGVVIGGVAASRLCRELSVPIRKLVRGLLRARSRG